MVCRLAPIDYHRFHFPDDCEVIDNYQVKGSLHSVNPLALQSKKDIFMVNERHVTILETKTFGRLAMIEVGAVCVGKIVQSYNAKFQKEEMKKVTLSLAVQRLFSSEKNQDGYRIMKSL